MVTLGVGEIPPSTSAVSCAGLRTPLRECERPWHDRPAPFGRGLGEQPAVGSYPFDNCGDTCPFNDLAATRPFENVGDRGLFDKVGDACPLDGSGGACSFDSLGGVAAGGAASGSEGDRRAPQPLIAASTVFVTAGAECSEPSLSLAGGLLAEGDGDRLNDGEGDLLKEALLRNLCDPPCW